jgi:hypothetical protein
MAIRRSCRQGSPAILVGRSDFLRVLARRLGSTEKGIADALKSPSQRKEIVSKKWRDLRDAFKELEKDVNLTTMILFSAPFADQQFERAKYCTRTLRCHRHGCATRAWLGWEPVMQICVQEGSWGLF